MPYGEINNKIAVILTNFETIVRISGKNGAANAGSRWINVFRMVIMIPISSSPYSSISAPQSEQRWQILSSLVGPVCGMGI